MKVQLEKITTEKQNPKTNNLDSMTPFEIVKIMNEEDKKVALAIEKELHNISEAVEKIVQAFKNGGRLVYVGAGTSGRLGILDAAECPPTFGTNPNQVIGLIAGGEKAVTKAIEGAEDILELGEKDLKNICLNNRDIVVGVAASGRTPYVIGGLKYAKKVGCVTISISCSENEVINEIVEIPITPIVGPEVLTGSTRLKAGTAQKLILNMLSTASMIGIGKVYKNLMVDVKPTNEKLVERAKRIVIMATGISYGEAEEILKKSNYNSKAAIVMIKTNCSYQESLDKIKSNNGYINLAIK